MGSNKLLAPTVSLSISCYRRNAACLQVFLLESVLVLYEIFKFKKIELLLMVEHVELCWLNKSG